ncbi:MAG TPA: hypothetical protein PKC45_07295 [Gemmatales bacterium]|nr:hypothetical protein [Gemmatales bacterium]
MLAAALVLLLLSGCRSSRQELLEMELRDKERQLEELKSKQIVSESDRQALELELEMTQRRLAKEHGPTPPSAGSVIFVRSLSLGRLTGGFRQDPQSSFDDALQVLIEPRDADESVVKAPGSVRIEVFEVSTQGIKSSLSQWELTARELRGKWEAPLIGGPAYRVTLPWKAVPSTERVRVVVRFTGLDGAVFEAERDATITIPDPNRPRPRPAVVPPSTPLPPHVPSETPFGWPSEGEMQMGSAPAGAPVVPADGRPRPGRRRMTDPGVAPASAPAPHDSAPHAPPPPGMPRGPTPRAYPELPPPPPVRVPLDPPLSFQMRPFSDPVYQAGHQTTGKPVDIRLEPPRPR